MNIIFSFNFNNELFIEDIWTNLITGVQVQIIDTILSSFQKFNIIYSPSSQLRIDIVESIIDIFQKYKNFNYCSYEDLSYHAFVNSFILITNDKKLAKDYVFLTEKKSILYIPFYLKKNINISKNFYLVNNVEEIKEILESYEIEKS